MVRGMNVSDITAMIGSTIVWSESSQVVRIAISPSIDVWTTNYLVNVSVPATLAFNGNISIVIHSLTNITLNGTTGTIVQRMSNIMDTASNQITNDITSPFVLFGTHSTLNTHSLTSLHIHLRCALHLLMIWVH
jgi:hypothetical protein